MKVPEPDCSVEILRNHFIGKGYPSAGQLRRLLDGFERRSRFEPVQYIRGWTSFAELKLKVRRPVFIPRPETPQLVDICIDLCPELLKNTNSENSAKPTFLEIGTGSGAISCLLLSRCKNLTGYGIEILPEAATLTKENLSQVADSASRYTLLEGDYHTVLPSSLPAPASFIVSNPPYIAHTDTDTLNKQVLSFESHRALFSHDEGLQDCADILRLCADPRVLLCDGFVAMELSAVLVQRLRQGETPEGWVLDRVCSDYYGVERFVVFRRWGRG